MGCGTIRQPPGAAQPQRPRPVKPSSIHLNNGKKIWGNLSYPHSGNNYHNEPARLNPSAFPCIDSEASAIPRLPRQSGLGTPRPGRRHR